MTAQPPPTAPRRPRRIVRRLFLVFLAFLVVAAAAALLTVARIPKLENMDSLSSNPLSTSTYLLIGSDSRDDVDDLEGSFGTFEGQRSDVVILARPSGGSLHLLSLPRDLKVAIPGSGTNKINAAYAFGGPDLLAQTVSENFGVPIHHVVEIDFGGFAELVDAVGGIDIAFPNAARDLKSGLDVPAGTTRIDGSTALAFVRSRSYQEEQGGSWVSVDADDIGRTARQQQALTALLKRVASPGGVAQVPRLALTLDKAVSVDRGFGVADLFIAGWGMRSANVDAATIPVNFSNEGGVSYVVRAEPEAGAMLERFLRGEPLKIAEAG